MPTSDCAIAIETKMGLSSRRVAVLADGKRKLKVSRDFVVSHFLSMGWSVSFALAATAGQARQTSAIKEIECEDRLILLHGTLLLSNGSDESECRDFGGRIEIRQKSATPEIMPYREVA